MRGSRFPFRRPFRFTVLVWAPALLLALAVFAGEEYGPVEIAPREWGTYRAHLPDDDAVRWSADWVLERVDEGPPVKYAVRDELRGRFEGDDREQTRITEAEFLLDRGRIRMRHSLLTVRDPKDGILFILEKEFDHTKGEVRTRAVYPETGKTERDTFELGDRLVDTKEIVSFLRGFPFPPPKDAEDADAEVELTLLNESPDTYSVLVTCEGVEEVETPAGTFACYKLRLVPDLGILTFLGRMLAPDIYMWFSVVPPHFWVKYRGLEGDLGTPSVISELVEFNTAPSPAPLPPVIFPPPSPEQTFRNSDQVFEGEVSNLDQESRESGVKIPPAAGSRESPICSADAAGHHLLDQVYQRHHDRRGHEQFLEKEQTVQTVQTV